MEANYIIFSKILIHRSFADAIKSEQTCLERDMSSQNGSEFIKTFQNTSYNATNSPLTDYMARLQMDQV